ncbi:hypothetical protein ACOYW6_01285 [Parablastomonas sp. CN1-191]|uniref:hypothetical protein n=1 Tax=Parablastomonas sp. CN1-191 TaxID=3400908 RepID=UPI003BF8461F
MAAWIGGRAATWTPLEHLVPPGLVDAARRAAARVSAPAVPLASASAASSEDPSPPHGRSAAAPGWQALPRLSAPPRAVTVDPIPPLPQAEPVSADRTAGAHQLMWMAAVAQLPWPPSLAQPPLPDARGRAAPRWSGDSWLFLRRGSTAAVVSGPGAATYGASQVGAVLRYRLAPGSAHEPAVYLRAASALAGPRQHEAAAGLALRPVAGVPVALLAEARVTADDAGARVRPAAMLVTQLAPFRLPGGLDGEFYAAGGYVGGRDATPFGDAQARVTRRVVSQGRLRLDIGGGAWAGGQRGAARADIGPTASLSVPLGPASARVAADWRLRVAGDARPAAGPALTISAGF